MVRYLFAWGLPVSALSLSPSLSLSHTHTLTHTQGEQVLQGNHHKNSSLSMQENTRKEILHHRSVLPVQKRIARAFGKGSSEETDTGTRTAFIQATRSHQTMSERGRNPFQHSLVTTVNFVTILALNSTGKSPRPLPLPPARRQE